jgi:hypothetical protein
MTEPQDGSPDRTSPDAPPRIRRFAGPLLLSALAASLILFAVYRRSANEAYLDTNMAIAARMTKLEIAVIFERELTLMERLADSPLIRYHFLNPFDEQAASQAIATINTYQRHLKQGCAFWATTADNVIRFCGDRAPIEADPDNPAHDWYFGGLASTPGNHVIPAFQDDGKKCTLYVTVPVKSSDGNRVLGMVGSAIDSQNLDERLAGAYELVHADFDFYIFNDRQTIYATNTGSDLIQSQITDVFPDLGPRLAKMAGVLDYGNRLFREGDDVFLLTLIPDCNFYLIIHFRTPAVATINRFIFRLFLGMLAIGAVVSLAFLIYCRRLANRSRPPEAPPAQVSQAQWPL